MDAAHQRVLLALDQAIAWLRKPLSHGDRELGWSEGEHDDWLPRLEAIRVGVERGSDEYVNLHAALEYDGIQGPFDEVRTPLSWRVGEAARALLDWWWAQADAGSTDIEIYVRDLDEARLLAWLDATCGAAREVWRDAKGVGYETTRGPVIVTHRMEGQGGRFAYVAFPWGRALWATDAACARQAVGTLGPVIQCDPGSDYPHVHPYGDEFLEVDDAGEHLFELPD